MSPVEAVIICIVVLVLAALVALVAYDCGENATRDEAVENGAAEYRCNKRGSVSFHWKKKR